MDHWITVTCKECQITGWWWVDPRHENYSDLGFVCDRCGATAHISQPKHKSTIHPRHDQESIPHVNSVMLFQTTGPHF